MKTTLFTKLLDETVIELKTDFKLTIERLCALQGCCQSEDCNGYPFGFACNKKGEFFVANYNSRANAASNHSRTYFVKGEVILENNITKVKFYSAYDRTSKFINIAAIICCPILFLIYALEYFVLSESKSLIEGLFVFAPLIIPFVFLNMNKKERLNKDSDLKLMKKEVLNRINAVENWNK